MTQENSTKTNHHSAIIVPKVLFEDTHLVVVNKPAGILSQADSSGEYCLVDWARDHFGRHYVGLVHRLDRNTSGLMVLAKRTKSARRLTESLQKRLLKREYVGIVMNPPVQQKGHWSHLLEKDPKTNETRVSPRGRPAQLNYRLLKKSVISGAPVGLMEFQLETGRSHQIRIQCATEGSPLIGDQKYGDPESTVLFHRPALHATRIEFPHPMSKEILKFEAPPADFPIF